MKTRLVYVWFIAFFMIISLHYAQATPHTHDSDASSDTTNNYYHTTVRGKRTINADIIIYQQDLRHHESTHVASYILTLPGIAGSRKAEESIEPVIRGQSASRVITTVNGLQLLGACPGKMDPPITYLYNDAIAKLQITKALPSVMLGIPGAGTTIQTDLYYSRLHPNLNEFGGNFTSIYDGGRQWGHLTGTLHGGSKYVDISLGGNLVKLDNYTASDGRIIPAQLTQQTGSVSATVRPSKYHHVAQTFLYKHDSNIDHPTLPMDNIDTDFWMYSARYTYNPNNSPLSLFQVHGGYASIDHLMDNRRKSNITKLNASTPSEAQSGMLKSNAQFHLSQSIVLDTGLEFSHIHKDAVRTRHIVASNQTFLDHIWPDASQMRTGIFAQTSHYFSKAHQLRLGIRGDMYASNASATEESSLGNRTIQEQFINFYGDQAETIKKQEMAFTGNALYHHTISPLLTFHIGAGFSMRPASITERYFAYAPAPGGYRVGNPSLRMEKHSAIDTGLKLRHAHISGYATIFYAYTADYINEFILQKIDVNNDTLLDNVFGYENINAHSFGGEISLKVWFLKYISLPMALSYVWHHDLSNNQPVAQTPPLEAHIALRFSMPGELPLYLQFGSRLVATQNRVSSTYPEMETDGFVLFHIRSGITIKKHITIDFNIENLSNQVYYEHLTKSALLPALDLMAGDRIPGIGRRLLITISGEF